MNDPAELPATAQPSPAPVANQSLGWPWFILQAATVALVYVIGSTLPVLPAVVRAVLDNAGEPELTSPVVAATAILGMAMALGTCWLWLRSERRVGAVFQLAAPASWSSTLAWAALLPLAGAARWPGRR